MDVCFALASQIVLDQFNYQVIKFQAAQKLPELRLVVELLDKSQCDSNSLYSVTQTIGGTQFPTTFICLGKSNPRLIQTAGVPRLEKEPSRKKIGSKQPYKELHYCHEDERTCRINDPHGQYKEAVMLSRRWWHRRISEDPELRRMPRTTKMVTLAPAQASDSAYRETPRECHSSAQQGGLQAVSR